MGDLFKPKTEEEVNMPKKVFLTLVLISSLLSLVWLASSQSTASKSLTKSNPSPVSSVPSKEAVSAKLATLERGWVKNEGQWDERALFSAPGYFGTTWITKDGQLVHVAIKGKESWVISERWVGGSVKTITPEEELPTKVSYFIGNDPSKHRSNLPTYRYVSLGEVWSGVEVKLKATQKTVEKLFYVKPGADPSKIVVEVDGAEGLKLSKDGEIIIKTGLGDLKLSKPIAWQEKDGKKLPVEVSYKLIGKNRYSFEVAKADPNLPIVIDPILQSTYLGGSDDDSASALAIHPTTGEVYVAGYTSSTNFPKATRGAQAGYGGGYRDVFVARLNKELTQILQSTYLGGRGWDEANALAIHPATGEVYVAGWTSSTNFPKTAGGAQASYGGGNNDTFVARLNKELTQILQSTYLGGKGTDEANALAIHPTTGDVYVAGKTISEDFPKATGGAQTRCNNCIISIPILHDAFVVRLNKELTQILQSTYLGGSGNDEASSLAIHPKTGEVYVAGGTGSKDFPKTAGGAQVSKSGDSDAFVARLNSSLTRILQSTYLGGSDGDHARALAIHPQTGEVYVAGYTNSKDFPKTTGGAQTRKRAYTNPFVARLSSDLTKILQATYLGGSEWDEAYSLAIHPQTGDVYVAGVTASKDFPNTIGGAQPKCNECSVELHSYDAFVARLNSNLTRILQSTYLGGSDSDLAYSLAVHPQTGEIYVAGVTLSSDFPKTAGGAQTRCNECIASRAGGSGDAFIARLSADLAAGRKFSDGGGFYTTSSVSSLVGVWNILLLFSVPAFVVARRIRRR
jgi:muconolactone delta-isomerase